jgi:Fe-S-cluster-containing dehydrogenase component
MFLDAEKKSPVNCDLCSGRRACGQEPACVKHCIGRALEIAGPERVSEIISSGIHSARIGKVWYVSSGWKLEKPW